ncbi:hypothetical protein [Brumimicrobium aurantiacum]|uniref:DUF5034 domain-containing protein n=1 Tax=Brumimicrobium aurantiacum TaxID=1737063 RepID=A0A3E1F064_9FLAO|nr:hypothetical protein [Brumimicrobium aurantiacum]RFC55212.1 hypothetical protein DXU93_05155 [Brumimicrobium aurantiacum]
MKMIKFGVYLLLVSGLIFACTQKYDNELVNIEKINLFLSDNRFEEPTTSNEESLSAKAFGLKLYLDLELTEDSDWEDEPDFSVKNTIDSIIITSSSNFDSEHQSGENLINHFSVFENYMFYSVQDYLSGDRVAKVNERKDGSFFESIDLLLKELPTQEENHEFTIRIVTMNNEVFEATSPSIQLTL